MSYTQLYLHLVWATHERANLISEKVEKDLWAVIGSRCRALQASPIRIGGMPDHLHSLVSLPPGISITRLVADLKGGSSHAMSHVIAKGQPFRWQEGYGAFTLRREDVPIVSRYILNQRQHHAARTAFAEWERCGADSASRLQPGSYV